MQGTREGGGACVWDGGGDEGACLWGRGGGEGMGGLRRVVRIAECGMLVRGRSESTYVRMCTMECGARVCDTCIYIVLSVSMY